MSKKPTLGSWAEDPRIFCSICRAPIMGRDSHNAQPINDGRCCAKCNAERVIPARLERTTKILGFTPEELKLLRPSIQLADKSGLLSSAADTSHHIPNWQYVSKETGEKLGEPLRFSQIAHDMVTSAKMQTANAARMEHRRAHTLGNRPAFDPSASTPSASTPAELDAETSARSKEEFFQWLEGPIELERVHHSIAHRITPDNLPVQAHILLVNHDWASLLRNSDTSGPSGHSEVRLPYPVSVFEFLFKGGVHAVCVAIQLDPTRDDDITATTHFKTKSAWFKTEIEVTYDERGVLKHPTNFNPSNPLIKVYDIITKNVFAISVMLEAQVAEATPFREPYKRNRPRPDGKAPPVLSHHIVSLARRHRSSRSDFPGEERRHPRLHFRRGHWRHYASHRTWIRWMLVGDPELGFVDKDYSL